MSEASAGSPPPARPVGPPLTGDSTLDVDPLAELGAQRPNLEHRRIVSVVRRRLFGSSHPPRIGRYTIEHRLGSGGMGEVYLAHDESLDRRLAIKRVHMTSARERDQQRLRREARALARLSHPNVVQIYEVDEHEGRTFLAMEYIDGQTLGAWLAEQDRPWRAILDAFLAAGRGLAAAHAAGLVHRDFKPDNVLLARDGSVRVADFGLALVAEDRRADVGDGDEATPRAQSRLSSAGAIMGTIRYMPYEQLCGGEVDARSDQFSFCAALYEALWNQSPFSLTSSAARLADLAAGQPAVPRRGQRATPTALWRAIRRGLSKDPAERWPDMPALLLALERIRGRRRRLAWAASALTVTAAAVGMGTMVGGEAPAEPCVAVERELQGTWDHERRAALVARTAELDAKHVADSQQRVIAGLDRWADGWVRSREQACHARAEQRVDAELASRASACLTRQRGRAGDLVELLLLPTLDADTLAAAVDAVAELPPGSACDDELALLGIDPPPPAIADQVETLRRDLDRAHELRLLGFVDQALTLAEQTERATRPLDYGPLHAEALAELAKAEGAGGSMPRALEWMQRAIDTAEIHHHDRLAAELWTELAMHTMVELTDEQTGAWQLHRAEVLNHRIAGSRRSWGRLHFTRGQLAELREDIEAAEQSYLRAIEEARQDEAAAFDLPTYLSSLARLTSPRDPSRERARALLTTALDEAERLYGPLHPQTAQRAYLLAAELETVEPERAIELFHRAAEIWTASHERPHRELIKARMLLAKFTLKAGDLDEAERQAHALASLQAESLPADHLDHGNSTYLLATIYAVKG
ncbi:MAG: serine/threonine protein kinase, partial [Myxococcales bacterium]|nr:serine/threonine protein kinase [Myxococcales bacterium]